MDTDFVSKFLTSLEKTELLEIHKSYYTVDDRVFYTFSIELINACFVWINKHDYHIIMIGDKMRNYSSDVTPEIIHSKYKEYIMRIEDEYGMTFNELINL